MLKTILFINGYPLSGKDTFAKVFRQVCSEKAIRVVKISTVDLPKQALKVLGWDGEEKSDAVRSALHDIKMAWVKHMDGSFNYVRSMVETLNDTRDDHILLVDSREPVELARFRVEFGGPLLQDITMHSNVKSGFNARTVFVDRKNSGRASNAGDMNVELFNYDYIVNNIDNPVDLAWVDNLEAEARRILAATVRN